MPNSNRNCEDTPVTGPPPADASSESLVRRLLDRGGALHRHSEYFERRPAQMRMAWRVAEAVRLNGTLVVEAGTGTGKTMAYLLPVLALGQRLIVSTATKALQDQILGKDVPVVQRLLQRPLSAVVLKGRANYLCRYRLRVQRLGGLLPVAEEARWAGRIARWARDSHTGDREELDGLPENLELWRELHTGAGGCTGRQCADYDDCFLVRARDRARQADLVVVNHHLFFADLALKDEGFGEILPQRDRVVFDEAHRVPDVATRFFGVELSNFQVFELTRDTRREFDVAAADDYRVHDALAAVEQGAANLAAAFVEREERGALEPADMDGLPGEALRVCVHALSQLRVTLEPHLERSAALAACGRRTEQMVGDAQKLLALDRTDRVHWYEVRGRGVFLHASPLEVGPLLEALLPSRFATRIYASATLATDDGPSGFDFALHQLGLCAETTVVERLPHAFDYQHRALLYLPTDLPPPNDPGFIAAALGRIRQLLDASAGRALCLFTSHRMLSLARDHLAKDLPYPLLCQGEGSKRELLARFTTEAASVLLATSSFWEGVDVPGESLSLVIIDRLPFDSPGDPLMAARARHLEAQDRRPFVELSVPRAVLALKQGLGRLLRRASDRGVMAILDQRLHARSYGRRMLAALPPAPVSHDVEDVYRFFREAP
ncbi:MAG: ATP-dependent DNA helicase [Magnetococcus sp. WYHC-3]